MHEKNIIYILKATRTLSDQSKPMKKNPYILYVPLGAYVHEVDAVA